LKTSKPGVLNLGLANPPGVHGKTSRGTWMAVELSCTSGKCMLIENSCVDFAWSFVFVMLWNPQLCQLTWGFGLLFYDSGVFDGKKFRTTPGSCYNGDLTASANLLAPTETSFEPW